MIDAFDFWNTFFYQGQMHNLFSCNNDLKFRKTKFDEGQTFPPLHISSAISWDPL